jgi:hypothetical protein
MYMADLFWFWTSKNMKDVAHIVGKYWWQNIAIRFMDIGFDPIKSTVPWRHMSSAQPTPIILYANVQIHNTSEKSSKYWITTCKEYLLFKTNYIYAAQTLSIHFWSTRLRINEAEIGYVILSKIQNNLWSSNVKNKILKICFNLIFFKTIGFLISSRNLTS